MERVIGQIDARRYVELAGMLLEHSRLFVYGEGRSGLVGRMIAMRLMHSGCEVYVVDETITPPIAEGDRLLIISGSGRSARIRDMAEKSGEAGYRVWLVTATREKLDEPWCSGGLFIPAATKHRKPGEAETIQPLGNQFDQAAHIVLDAAVIDGPAGGKGNDSLKGRHANL